MVLVEEVPDGGWGIGDEVLTVAQFRGNPPRTTDEAVTAIRGKSLGLVR
jgi:hypothetical protein